MGLSIGRQVAAAEFEVSAPAQIRSKLIPILELVVGYSLITATIWTAHETQQKLFWISAAWFFILAVVSVARGDTLGLRRPPLRLMALTVPLTIVIATGMVIVSSLLGTLHGLFGTKRPLLHASMYLLWSLVQQCIQQCYFFTRVEKIVTGGIRASFITAALFAVAHLPNPVLTFVTLFGGWILSEIYRRYRTVYPLAIAHGLIGLAIAISVPDQLHHHMRVGLGYLRYPR
jgi:membrane protease YdiL (CAAX protease family)